MELKQPFEIEEVSIVEEREVQKGKIDGTIKDLDKIVQKENGFITISLCVTVCVILTFSLVWGAVFNCWTPLDRSKDIVALMGYFIMVLRTNGKK